MKNVYNSSDLAFLELPNQKYSEYYYKLSQMYDLKENNYITIVSSGLVNHYTTNKKSYVNSWNLIIRKILGNGYLTVTGRMHASVSTFQMKKPAYHYHIV